MQQSGMRRAWLGAPSMSPATHSSGHVPRQCPHSRGCSCALPTCFGAALAIRASLVQVHIPGKRNEPTHVSSSPVSRWTHYVPL